MKSRALLDDKICPVCDLVSTPEALRCDCGYDFASGRMKESYLKNPESPEEIENRATSQLKASAIVRMIGVAGIAIGTLLVISFTSTAVAEKEINFMQTGDQLFGGVVLLAIGLACLRSITRSEMQRWKGKNSINWFAFEYVRQFVLGSQHVFYLLSIIAIPIFMKSLFNREGFFQPLLGVVGFLGAIVVFQWVSSRMAAYRYRHASKHSK